MSGIATIVGGGVIGGGWAARFLLNGWDVRVLDPDPDAERKIGEVVRNARRSMPGLADAPLPPEGKLSFHESAADAVAGSSWIQESAPERLDLKRRVLEDLVGALGSADPGAVIASSTSGFKPSDLQAGQAAPDRILVAHPFNPVYLLPLVEIVGTERNSPETLDRASAVLESLGMFPLRLRREIDAHLADRFLEAVWREALWLVKDGYATTAEIDDSIRYGFGLRWAQMGLFDTYRVAGGEAGMRHFMAQFGPCLAEPWTRLTDVPEFDDALVDLIAGQSDAQSGHMEIREMERVRDSNLVAIMRALKWAGFGAGAVLRSHDERLRGETGVGAPLEARDLSGPLLTLEQAIPLDWTDYNGHMTESRYLDAFARATDRFMELVGCDADYIAAGGSYFTAETHIRHLDEAKAGDRIAVGTDMLAGEGKKLHLFHTMTSGERTLATGEHFLLHVDLGTRKSCPAGPAVEAGLASIRAAREARGGPPPEGAGACIRAPA